MGLDMYLYASKHLSNMYAKEDEIETFNAIKTLMKADDFVNEDSLRFASIKMQVAYWRKANAIHKFFVSLDGGTDECQDIYVSRESLQELLNRCNTILEHKDVEKAVELLPTQSGFFFGGTEYNEYYFNDLDYTQEVLTKILQNAPEDWDFDYRASW